MAKRPRLILFDVVETMFSLDPILHRLSQVGLDGQLWLSRLFRDAFALEVAGIWRSFREIADAELAMLSSEHAGVLDSAERERLLSALSELPPYDDVRPALAAARAAGISCACLTNGGTDGTLQLFHRAGIEPLPVISADDLQHWKPLWDVYLHAADTLGHDPHDLALVSAHDWDIEGARQASFTTAWVSRRGACFSPLLAGPDVGAASLVEAVQGLLALPKGMPSRPPTETLH